MVRTARKVAILVVLALSLSATGIITLRPARAQTTTITIVNFAFAPASVTVPAGTTITWTNQDTAPHTVTSDTGLWDSGTVNIGGSYSHTFSTPGTFPYHCAIHPFMKAEVIVQASGTTGTATPAPAATSAASTATSTATPASTSTSTPQPAATSAAPKAKAHFQIKVSGSLRAGHSATVRVSVANSRNHRPVGSAAVTLDARQVGVSRVLKAKSNGKGIVTFRNLRPKRTGKAVISVSKKGYAGKRVTVKVRE
jgi:plastocyanin